MYRVTTSLFFLMSSLLFATSTYAQYVVTRVDINPGPSNSFPKDQRPIDTFMYFNADNGTNGAELWRSNGTVNGTVMIKDINTGLYSSTPDNFVKYNGKVYFSAADANGRELWETDGTANGTKMVKDINSGAASSNPDKLFVGLGKIFFTADDGSTGTELWISDGTTNGTQLLKDIKSGGGNTSRCEYFYEHNGLVYFGAEDGSSGKELWITDGTTNGTKLLRDIMPGKYRGYYNSMTVFNNQLVFIGDGGSPSGIAIWTTDGTTNGTQMLLDPLPNLYSSVNSDFVHFKNKLYFTMDSSDNPGFVNNELGVTDLTQNGTKIVKQIHPNRHKSGLIDAEMVYVDSLDLLFFEGDDSVHEEELWISDGTEQGTKMVKDFYAPGGTNLTHLTAYAGKAFFDPGDDNLWYSNGTDTGTKQLLAVPQGKSWQGITGFISPKYEANGSLFFFAEFDSTGRELWIIRDTTYKFNDTSNNPPQAITDITSNNFKIAPNPAHNSVHISFDMAIQNATISLTDISGMLIHKEKVAGSLEQTTFKLPTVSPGIYLINITHSDGIASQRLRIE